MSINNKRIEKFKGLVTFTPNKPLPLVKSLLKGLTNSSGRNNMGKIMISQIFSLKQKHVKKLQKYGYV